MSGWKRAMEPTFSIRKRPITAYWMGTPGRAMRVDNVAGTWTDVPVESLPEDLQEQVRLQMLARWEVRRHDR